MARKEGHAETNAANSAAEKAGAIARGEEAGKGPQVGPEIEAILGKSAVLATKEEIDAALGTAQKEADQRARRMKALELEYAEKTHDLGERYKDKAPKEAALRDDFTRDTKEFVVVRNGYATVDAMVTTPSPAGDIALVYAFMKMQDPNSAILPSEKADVGNTAGVTVRIRTLYNKLLTGENLDQTVRMDLLNQARVIYANRLKFHDSLVQQYRGIAESSGLDPRKTVLDLVGDLRPPAAGGTPSPLVAPAGTRATHRYNPKTGKVEPIK